MIRKSAITILLAIGCITSLASRATAEPTWGFEAFGAFSTHSMNDWNERIVAPTNAGGGDMKEFNSGFGGGLGVRMWPTSEWMVAATWEPMFVSREEKVSGAKADLKANAFEATGGYYFPATSQARFGVGAGLGIYQLGGKITQSGTADTKLKGSTVGFHFMGLMEWNVRPGFAVTANAGYRVAKISDTKADDQSASPKFETDYSGLMLRGGFAFYLPKASH